MTRATNKKQRGSGLLTINEGSLLRASDIGLRGSHHYIEAWPGDVYRIHRD